MRKRAILKKSEIFYNLTDAECNALTKFLEEREVKAGTVLLKEGEDARYLYLCVDGELRVEMNVGFRESMEVSVATVGPGKIAGWSALIEDGKYTATVRAVKDSKVFVFEKRKLLEFFSKNRGVGFRVLQNLLKVVSHRLINSRVQLLSCVLVR